MPVFHLAQVPPSSRQTDEHVLHGIFGVLRSALHSLAKRVLVAFVFGSAAREEETERSDVDLMVVGKATLQRPKAACPETDKLRLGRNRLGDSKSKRKPDFIYSVGPMAATVLSISCPKKGASVCAKVEVKWLASL